MAGSIKRVLYWFSIWALNTFVSLGLWLGLLWLSSTSTEAFKTLWHVLWPAVLITSGIFGVIGAYTLYRAYPIKE